MDDYEFEGGAQHKKGKTKQKVVHVKGYKKADGTRVHGYKRVIHTKAKHK